MHVPYVIFIQNIYGMLFCSFAVKETKTAKDVTVVSYFCRNNIFTESLIHVV